MRDTFTRIRAILKQLRSTIIISAFHGDEWLPGCIKSLSNNVAPGTHLVIVDNHGNHVISQLDLSRFDAEIIKTDRKLGFAEANNLALTRAKAVSPSIVFLNQDTLTDDSWIEACTNLLETRSDVAAVTPLTRNYGDSDWDPYFLECATKSCAFQESLSAKREFDSFYDVPVIPAAAMVVRTDVLKLVGPFDPIFGSYYEDYDLCWRIRRAGYKVGVCTLGTVLHYSGSTATIDKLDRRRARWVTRNRVIHKLRTGDGNRALRLLGYLLSTFPRGLARILLRRPGRKPLGPYLAAHWDLLMLLPRLVSRRRDESEWRRYLAGISWRTPDTVDGIQG